MAVPHIPSSARQSSVARDWIPAALPSCQLQRVQELRRMGLLEADKKTDLTWPAVQALSFDPLTELPLARLFSARIDYLIERTANPFAVIIINCHRFRLINELYGRDVADDMLRLLARRLQRLNQPSVFFARLRDDRFGIILNKAHQALADEFINTLEATLAKPMRYRGHRYQLSFSVGIQWREQAQQVTAQALLVDAEQCLAQARRQQQQHLIAIAQQPQFIAGLPCERAALLNARLLKEQIEVGTLPVQIEPVINLRSRAVYSYRAQPALTDNGEVLPLEQVLRCAEREGLAQQLLNYVLAASIRQFAAARIERSFLSVPISPLDVSNQGLFNQAQRLLRQNQLPNHQLIFDLHTHHTHYDWQSAIADIFELQQLDSSAYAKRQSARPLLIDVPSIAVKKVYWMRGAMLQKAIASEKDRQLLNATVNLARSLNVDVMAQQVQTTAQAEMALAVGILFACGPGLASTVPLSYLR